jgi:hypothetical protein
MKPRDSYAACGRATRQAHARMRELHLTSADWDVGSAVLDLTTAYSRLEDEIAVVDLVERSGRSQRQVRYSLAKFNREFVFAYSPGRGRGRLSTIGVPREREWPSCEVPTKAADSLPLSPAGKGQRSDAKSGKTQPEKGQPTRTRAHTRISSHTEKADEHVREAFSSERVARITDALCRSTNSTSNDARVGEAVPIVLDLVSDLTDQAAVIEIERRADNLGRIYSNRGYVTPSALARDWPKADDNGSSISPAEWEAMVAALNDPEVRRRL